MIDIQLVKLHAKIELAKREFFYYCNLKAPNFYKRNRKYLVEFCNDLQEFYESNEYKAMIINMPPRHGKSRTAGLFVEWVLGINQNEHIMTGSYNETLSTTFSKSVRNNIMEVKADERIPVYSDVFPLIRIKRGDGAMNLWSLEGGFNNYLATSPSGTATGFGATLLIIDDLIKLSEEAYNENVKAKHWDWFTNTMLSRLEEGGKIIIVMTRWSSDDLAGRALAQFKELGYKVKHVNMKAVQDDGSMLCDEVLSKESFEMKKALMGEDIVGANYQQTPIDLKGKLYTSFMTYDGELPKFKEIRNYTDTADTGDDYLCSIDYGVTFQNEAYILDILYTKESMETTEVQQAEMMFNDKVNIADIESNNGGRSYSRNVERIMMEKFNSNYTIFNPFHQSNNKAARILSNSTWVMKHIYYPSNWKHRFPEYYDAMNKYQKEGKNKHDDAPDCTTGIAEKIGAGDTYSFD